MSIIISLLWNCFSKWTRWTDWCGYNDQTSLHFLPSIGQFHKEFISVPHCQNKRQHLSFNLLQYVISGDSRIVNTLEKIAGDCPNKNGLGTKGSFACAQEESVCRSCQCSSSKLCISSVWNHRLLTWLSGFSSLQWAVHG